MFRLSEWSTLLLNRNSNFLRYGLRLLCWYRSDHRSFTFLMLLFCLLNKVLGALQRLNSVALDKRRLNPDLFLRFFSLYLLFG